MDFRELGSRILSGREQWVAVSETASAVTVSSLSLTTTPLVIRQDGMMGWEGRALQIGNAGTNRIEAFIREFLRVAAPYVVVQEEFNPLTNELIPRDVDRAPYFVIGA